MPIVDGLRAFLTDVQGWMIGLGAAFYVIQLIQLGYNIMNSEDGHEEKRIKSKFIRMSIGIAIVSLAPWVGNTVLGYFA